MVFAKRFFAFLTSRNCQVSHKLKEGSNEQKSPSKTIAAELINPQTFCDPNEHVLTEFTAIAVENYDVRIRLSLTDHSLIVLPIPKFGWRDMPPLPPFEDNVPPAIQHLLQQNRWKIPLADIVQCLIVHEPPDEPVTYERMSPAMRAYWKRSHDTMPASAKACARIIIGSKACICGPVPYEERSVKWKKENQAAIDHGKIGVEEIREYKYDYLRGYHCYRLPEGWFFDQSGHCLCFYLYESEVDCAEKLFARIVALRKDKTDPQSYKSADESRNTAPWLAVDESLEKQWQCKTPSQGILSRFLGTPTFSLKIYLTSSRLITEVTGNKKVEISDFPIECVRGLTWNIGPTKGSLKVSTFGLSGLQWPTSSLLKHGYWAR